MKRRQFIKSAFGAAAVGYIGGAVGILFPDEAVAFSETTGFWERDRIITFRRPDTGENGVIRHFSRREGGYLQDGYRQACWYLRDSKDNNSVAKMDIQLLNLLYAIQEWARMAGKTNPVMTINSAYRTRRRNAQIEGAALNSMHVAGRAVDITIRGIENWQVAEMAKHFNGGGVGHYNSFTHVDTGKLREWRG